MVLVWIENKNAFDKNAEPLFYYAYGESKHGYVKGKL